MLLSNKHQDISWINVHLTSVGPLGKLPHNTKMIIPLPNQVDGNQFHPSWWDHFDINKDAILSIRRLLLWRLGCLIAVLSFYWEFLCRKVLIHLAVCLSVCRWHGFWISNLFLYWNIKFQISFAHSLCRCLKAYWFVRLKIKFCVFHRFFYAFTWMTWILYHNMVARGQLISYIYILTNANTDLAYYWAPMFIYE